MARQNKKMQDIPAHDRPREKLLRCGPDKLNDAELVATIIRTGSRGEGALKLAERFMHAHSDLTSIRSASDCKAIFGFGTVKSCQMLAAIELGRRLFNHKQEKLYATPKDIWREMREYRSSKKEFFVVFYLNSRSSEMHRSIISMGSLETGIVHPREVYEPAIAHSAAHIVVSHNHPSGDPEPSGRDMLITKRLADAGAILGIELLDHVIVSAKSFVSLKSRGALP